MSTPRVTASNALSGPKCVVGARMHLRFLCGSHVVNVVDMYTE